MNTPNHHQQSNEIQMQLMGNYQEFKVPQVMNGLQKLAQLQGIFIKQKFETKEVLTGCETPNVYKVYAADTNGNKTGKKKIFKCKEKSDCCQRICLPGDCRPFLMKVSNQEHNNDGLFLQLERPFKCTFLCLDRPVLKVVVAENGESQYCGQIKNPFLCCALGCEVEDASGNLKYIITGSRCQLGYCCMSLPCNDCQQFIFEVRNPTGQIVTTLVKKSAGCLKSCFGDADNFALGFPIDSEPIDKALLMSSALFLDYMYFENKSNDKKA